MPCAKHLRIVQNISMRQQHALRRSRCPRRVLNVGNVIRRISAPIRNLPAFRQHLCPSLPFRNRPPAPTPASAPQSPPPQSRDNPTACPSPKETAPSSPTCRNTNPRSYDRYAGFTFTSTAPIRAHARCINTHSAQLVDHTPMRSCAPKPSPTSPRATPSTAAANSENVSLTP